MTGNLFSQEISIYAHAKDATGQYTEEVIDTETGEVVRVPVKQMTIEEFCLTDRFRDKVQTLRQMQAQYGSEAKKMPEYDRLKRSLPAATLSGLFSYRRQADLVKHSGYIVLDMDYGDNKDNEDWLDWETMKEDYFQYFPEIALCMRSCSGTGYFALVPLAYPEQHKAQARAIMELYVRRGIILDRSCKDPTRLRFASWDSHPYTNQHAVPYTGIDYNEPIKPLSRSHYTASIADVGNDAEMAERLVAKIESQSLDVTGSYDQCFRIGVSLANLGTIGLGLWKRVCRFRSPSAHAHFVTDAELEREYKKIGCPERITIATFFQICKDYNVTIR